MPRSAANAGGGTPMKLPTAGEPHLTYCTNIHAGETWGEIRRNVAEHVLAVKARVGSERPFGVGLRLSGQAAEELAQPRELESFRDWLGAHGAYVFTINGFPYGQFHGTRVKEAVYLPDWFDEERVRYTERLGGILAALLPDGVTGSVSTVPGAFRPRVPSSEDAARMANNMLRVAASFHALHASTGKVVRLAAEPEPFCHFETTDETIRYFQEHVFSGDALARFEAMTGLGRADAEAAARRHAGVCFDACHMAVEFEDPRVGPQRFASAGIGIYKVQLSAGLDVRLSGEEDDAKQALARFADDTYLHQVVEHSETGLIRYLDLPEALEAPVAGPRHLRVHFHVPIFRETLGPFRNTQTYLRELLLLQRDQPVSDHLEVETYTWDVLPAEYRNEHVVDAVAREMQWVLDVLDVSR
ncbi:metabolite traffic protein EboE [Pendulispora brunnea]|uniref:Metabolite traffic protein EboE n=1 Tax=Pendulispora brunnea TaxID=2905690 RepID=A0ABZ2KCS8_9BACT